MKTEKRGFMDGTDFQHHLESDAKPISVFVSEASLRRNRTCLDECGIAEVEIKIIRWVVKPTV